jgi:hypothetical protein
MIEQFRFVGISDEAVMIEADFDSDGNNEYVLVQMHESGSVRPMYFYETEEGWQQGNLTYTWQNFQADDFAKSVKEGAIELEESRYKDLRVGDVVLRPN